MASLPLRIWLRDEIYSILEQRPTRVPSSLSGIQSVHPTQLPPLPEDEGEREAFLEDEKANRPRDLIYRFYACGGFWLSDFMLIGDFLQSFSAPALVEMVPFLRQVFKALAPIFDWADEQGENTTSSPENT